MTANAYNSGEIYGSINQRFARFLHTVRARYRPKKRSEVRFLNEHIPPHGVIFDIGANMGFFAKEFARIHEGSCQVHCFEPLSYNFSILESVASRYHNVNINNFALSDKIGEVDINVPVRRGGKISPGLAHFGAEVQRNFIKETVKTMPLDRYFSEQGLSRLDFVKCDVEGAELLVLNGGSETFRRYRPAVLCEVTTGYTARLGYNAEDVFRFFHDLGYTAYDINFDHNSLVKKDHYDEPGDYLFKIDADMANA